MTQSSPASEVLDFLNSIEGAVYGGMASFEIARAHMQDMVARQCSAGTDDDWQDDPAADERWQAGCDYAMMRLCDVLGVEMKSVRWDAATETLDGDVCAVLWNILVAKYGDGFDPSHTLKGSSDPAQPSWLLIDDYARSGKRIILGWDDSTTLPMHSEMGWFKAGVGWCNTYGKPFAGGPTHYMPMPAPPSTMSSTMRHGPCQVCGETADLKCCPSRFGDETWACNDCWNPDGVAVSRPGLEGGSIKHPSQDRT